MQRSGVILQSVCRHHRYAVQKLRLKEEVGVDVNNHSHRQLVHYWRLDRRRIGKFDAGKFACCRACKRSRTLEKITSLHLQHSSSSPMRLSTNASIGCPRFILSAAETLRPIISGLQAMADLGPLSLR